MFYYRVFGLLVRSQIEFPELDVSGPEAWESDASRQVDVVIGPVPDVLEGPKATFDWIEADPTRALFKVRGRGRIFVESGRRIGIAPDAPEKLVELGPYMVTCGFATLAFHRGWVPLHVGAVGTPRGVVLFCGPSGAGKSTTTTAVAKLNGWRLLADDMIVVEPSARPMVHIGVKRIKLWESAAQALGVDVTGLAQDYFRPFKYHAVIEAASSFELSDVVGVIRLEWSNELRFHRRSQAYAFQEVLNSIYPPYFGALYLDPGARNAALQSLFPVALSGTLTRDQGGEMPAALTDLAELVRGLVEAA